MPRPSLLERARRHWVAVAVGVALVVVAGLTMSRVATRPGQVAQSIVVASGPWAPFVGPDLADDGPVSRIVVEALRRAGYAPQVSFSSWAVVAERTSSREVVGAFPYIATASRRADFVVSDAILAFDYVLFAPAPAPAVDLAGLADMRIGLIDGYAAWQELDELVEFVPVPTAEQGFRCLIDGAADEAAAEDLCGEHGPIDLLVEGRLSGRAVVAANPAWDADAVEVLAAGPGDDLAGVVASEERLHLLAPRSDQGAALVAAFDEALADVRGSELYREALADIKASGGDRATLVPAGNRDLPLLWSSQDGDVGVVTPVGTRVTVIDWSPAFTTPGPGTAIDPGRLRVKVDSGPSAGEVMWVDAAALRLQADS